MSGHRLTHAPHKWTSEDDQKLRELFDQGIKLLDIAHILGLTEGAVTGRVKRRGWRRPAGWVAQKRVVRNPRPPRSRQVAVVLPSNSAESLRADFMEQDEKFRKAMRRAIMAGLERLPVASAPGTGILKRLATAPTTSGCSSPAEACAG